MQFPRILFHKIINERQYWVALILLCGISIYSITWSYISIERYYSLSAYVYDSGLEFQRMWDVFHIHWTFYSFIKYFSYSGDTFLFAPLIFFKSYEALYIVQSIFLAIPAIPLYLISRNKNLGNFKSLLIALAYLLYFPLSGMNFFDFHFQSFFIFFFVIAYYFYLTEKYPASMIMFVLSGLVRFPFMIFPITFCLIEIFSLWRNRELSHSFYTQKFKFISILIILSSTLLFVGLITQGIPFFFQNAHSVGSLPSLSGNSDLNAKLFTVFIFLLPFLFLNLLSFRWSIFLLPYIVLLFSSNFLGYQFPIYYDNNHYAALLIPFVFLGFIDAYENLNYKIHLNLTKWKRKETIKRVWLFVKKIFITKTPYYLFIAIVIMAAFFQPYGPLNKYSGHDNFGWPQEYVTNMTQFKVVERFDSLIPANENLSNILVQDNLPMILPRPANIYFAAYVPSLTPFYSGINLSDANMDLFPIYYGNGVWANASFQYVIAVKNTFTYYSGYPNMGTFINLMLESHKFGVLASEDNVILLERCYIGPPVIS